MSRRFLWPIALTLSAAGVLVGHDVAYRLAGLGSDGLHGYLAHAPQLLVALLLPAGLVAVSGSARVAPRPWTFALLGVGGFAAMEHLERVGSGGLPLLVASPVFLLGLALQLPFALAAWWVARTLLALETPARRAPGKRPRVFLELPGRPAWLAPVPARARPQPRGPPPLL